jgi:hypothetical protein
MRPFHQDHVYCSTEDKTGTGIGVLRAGSCVLAASDSLGFDNAELLFPTLCDDLRENLHATIPAAIIRVALERDVRTPSRHPHVERIMQKQIRQDGAYDHREGTGDQNRPAPSKDDGFGPVPISVKLRFSRFRRASTPSPQSLPPALSAGCMEHANYMLHNQGTDAMVGLNPHTQRATCPTQALRVRRRHWGQKRTGQAVAWPEGPASRNAQSDPKARQ